MPTGNETNHELAGLTVRGGFAMGQNGPYLAEGEVVNPFSAYAPRYGFLETFPRSQVAASNTLTSQRLQVMLWTCPVSKLVSTMALTTAATPASSTIATVQYGIYTLSDPKATGAALTLTLASQTAIDATGTGAWSTGNTEYPLAISTPYQLNAGQRYGLALLVNAGVAGTVACATGTVNAGLVGTGLSPQLGTHTGSVTSLSGSLTCANTTTFAMYVAFS